MDGLAASVLSQIQLLTPPLLRFNRRCLKKMARVGAAVSNGRMKATRWSRIFCSDLQRLDDQEIAATTHSSYQFEPRKPG